MGRGDFTYASPDAGANGADAFRAAIAGDATHTYWRVDWNTLIDPAVPVATWAFDTDADTATGTASWPADAGVASPGADTAMIVSSRGAWLVDAATRARTDLTASGATVTVDETARSFVVAVPRTVMPADDTWTVRLAAGVANASGDGSRPLRRRPTARASTTRPSGTAMTRHSSTAAGPTPRRDGSIAPSPPP